MNLSKRKIEAKALGLEKKYSHSLSPVVSDSDIDVLPEVIERLNDRFNERINGPFNKSVIKLFNDPATGYMLELYFSSQ